MDRGSESGYLRYPREVEDFPTDTEDHAPHYGGVNYKESSQRSAIGHCIEHRGT